MQTGFDNDWYATMQAEQIRMRIGEFGGKLLDDYHANRVLPGFAPTPRRAYSPSSPTRSR